MSIKIENFICFLKQQGAEISIDSRTIKHGDIFFAINKGINFVNEAVAKGASVVVVQDSVQTLLKVGTIIKNNTKAKIIGITGSVGKTTTKIWLSEILGAKHNVLCGIKNYNTIIGLPFCLTQLQLFHEYGIFEIGSSNQGEIKNLSSYLQPDIAIITNIGEAHIGKFGNKKVIAEEKISIIDGIKNEGILIYNGDSEFNELIIKKAKTKNLKTITYGFASNNDFVALGNHYDFIKTCIKATLFALNLKIDEYKDRIDLLNPPEGRGNIKKYKYNNKEFTIIDSTYNSCPSSVIASLHYLSGISGFKRKIAILGEMKELGEYAEEYLNKVKQETQKLDINKVVFIDSNDIDKIPYLIENNDVILLKGSRSVGLEKILNVFQFVE
jgi:UDP-N-acetylmuramoyl-tripeptide--D-alanyl-D-alanine ligase